MNGSGVVHQQIEPATLPFDSREQSANRGVVSVVDLHRNSTVARIGHRSAGQIDPPTVGNKGSGDAASCATARPSHDRHGRHTVCHAYDATC